MHNQINRNNNACKKCILHQPKGRISFMCKVRVQMRDGAETWDFDDDAPIVELVRRVKHCLKAHHTFCILDDPLHPKPIVKCGKISDRYHRSSLIVIITPSRITPTRIRQTEMLEEDECSVKRRRVCASSTIQYNKRTCSDPMTEVPFKRLCLS